MAPEFYNDLPQHKSWIGVIYRFITDPTIGPYSRIIRAAASTAKATREINGNNPNVVGKQEWFGR